MVKHLITMVATSAISLSTAAKELTVEAFDYYGPVEIPAAVTLGEKSPVEKADILDYEFSVAGLTPASVQGAVQIESSKQRSLHAVAFNIENRRFAKARILINGVAAPRLGIDGESRQPDSELALSPGTHRVEIKYATDASTPASSLDVKIESDAAEALSFPSGEKRMFTLNDVLCGARITGASMSPSGRFLLETVTDTEKDATSHTSLRLYDLKAKTPASLIADSDVRWMPTSDKLYAIRSNHEYGRHIVIIDPTTNRETVFAHHLPDGDLQMSPTEDFLIFTLVREGQKEDPDAYQILEPDDRQSGWRDRTYAAIYRHGVMIPLTSGVWQTNLLDISSDGSKALIMTSHSRLSKRPTSLMSILAIDLNTLHADTIVAEDGFISAAAFSPSGKEIVVTGSPEAFGSIGCTLPEGKLPSMSEHELFLVDLATKKATPLTRDFAPCPETVAWCRHDGKIYFTAENRDMLCLYSLDPHSGKTAQLPIPENVVKGFGLSAASPAIAVWAQSDSNPDRLYAFNTKTSKATLLHEPSASRLANVKLGTCQDWNFTNERGDTVYGRFYLPDNFDPTKKYPLIVNYYGGCSPTTRTFESRYPHHLYSSLEYVVYVLQPSGATGFGQEWSSRHVSTAGKGVADDIIQGTKKFTQEHPYVDASKIGCIGASYGGFMTMYLQTVTDIFAAAVSHAGISDHTSYWGEGYWGYNYSEVSMGNDKPWSNPDLYVKQSPLYNAHKVKTPLLFVHGDGDTNVPPGESIQMFTALKLLGCPTALVEISGQNHHILAFGKRHKWQNTIFAWFAKYLKDDPDWWNHLYPAKNY